MDNMLPRVSNYVYIFCHWLANFKRDQNQAYRSNNLCERCQILSKGPTIFDKIVARFFHTKKLLYMYLGTKV